MAAGARCMDDRIAPARLTRGTRERMIMDEQRGDRHDAAMFDSRLLKGQQAAARHLRPPGIGIR